MNGCDCSSGELLLRSMSRREDVDAADRKRAVKEYGDVEYADSKNKKYPLDAEHIHAAISYWGMPKNRAEYSSEEQKTISARIARAAKKHGIDAESLKKGRTVGRYDEALVKAISGEGPGALDDLMKGAICGVKTENSGNQGAPGAETKTVGSGQAKGYAPGTAGTGKSGGGKVKTSSPGSIDEEDEEGATAVERKGGASVEGFSPIKTSNGGDQGVPGAEAKTIGDGQPKGYAKG